jgi:predicted nucleotidyltransferase component of viral defense system
MLTRYAITQRADADGVDALVAERDYVLAHIIAQLHHAAPSDGGRLVFKGGTALRFVYVRDYRYSADLDFSVVDGAPEPGIASIGEVLAAARAHAGFPRLELNSDGKPAISYVGCRDLYDLWRLTEDKGVVLGEILPLFERKAWSKGINPASFRDKFEDRIDRYKRRWTTEMSEHLADPPRFDDVVRAVRRHLRTTALLST